MTPADTGGHSSLASHEAAAAELTFISGLVPIQPTNQPINQHQLHQQLQQPQHQLLINQREEERRVAMVVVLVMVVG